MIANQLLDIFTDASKVTKSYILATNTPTRVIVLDEQSNRMAANESSVARQKRGRPIGSKDTIPRKRKTKDKNPIENDARVMKNATFSKISTQEELTAPAETGIPEEVQSPEEIQNIGNIKNFLGRTMKS